LFRRFFIGGCLSVVGGFYWLYTTIADFGGMPFVAALPVFALFVTGTAVQFLLWSIIWYLLPTSLDRVGLRAALSWLTTLVVCIRIFPWDFGHTQAAFLQFVQVADIGGVTLISVIMLWTAESILLALQQRFSLGLLCGPIVCIASLLYGTCVMDRITAAYGPSLRVVLVQGNVSLAQKHDVTYFTVNRERYLTISKSVSHADSLIVWPESTITDFIPADLPHARYAKILPFLGDGSAFLVGGLTFDEQRRMFNSALLIRPDGSLSPPYNKVILMPFGEFTPFSKIFPWIKNLNPTAGDFTSGEGAPVVTFTLSNGTEVPIGPLICYEDVVPSMASHAVNHGAQLLVNLTNDAWFGNTVQPYQHHLIAGFRAIETRRFLVRSTNTGLTAVVDPLGRTLAELPPYSEGTLETSVNLMKYEPIYGPGVQLGWNMVAAIVTLVSLASLIRRWRTGDRSS